MTTENPAPPSDNGDPAPAPAKEDGHTIPKARLDEEVAKRRALETEYSALADAVLAEIPEHLKPLIPAELSPTAKLKWYQEAKKTGVFNTKPTVPETDTTKPKTTPKDVDLSTLPPTARMAAAYKKAN